MNLITKIALGALAAPAMQIAAQTSKPNVILIMTDQQSYNAISAHADLYGGSYFSTPNIDRLAVNGLSFTRTYCANPVSVPSRFSLFTGMFGGQYGIRENRCPEVDETEVRTMLDNNGMGNVFTRGGYDTYYGGKVHLPFSGKAGSSKFAAPAGYGFTDYFTEDERDGLGIASAKIIEEKAAQGKDVKPFLLVASFLNPHDICLESSTNLFPLVESKKEGKKDLIAQCVRQMRERAAAIDSVTFYQKHVPALPFNFAKTEDFPAFKKNVYKDFPNWYWQKYRWTYGQLVSLVDSHIGHILDALDRHPELKRNTIIVFTSDHGEMQGAHQTVTKNLPYEECQRVPFIFCGAGIPRGERDNSLVCNGTDLLPTLCQLAGIALPEKTDGISLAPRLLGRGEAPQRQALYIEGDGFSNVISGTDKYTQFTKGGGEMLIDLKADHGELKNIITENGAKAKALKDYIPAEKQKVMSDKVKNENKVKNGNKEKKGNKEKARKVE